MQQITTSPDRDDPAGRSPNWYGTLWEIVASERLFRFPDCEFLLDRLASDDGERT